MKIDNVKRAAALVNERGKLNSFILALESNPEVVTGEFTIEYWDWEITGFFSKALIKDALVDRKNTIEKELEKLGVEV
jgi:hypothetical protein